MDRESFDEINSVVGSLDNYISQDLYNLPSAFIEKLNILLKNIYIPFTISNNLINFEELLLLYKNFGIFPSDISLIKMKEIFFSLVNLFIKTEEYMVLVREVDRVKNNKKAFINYDMFVYSLCLIGIINNSKLSNIQKIMNILHKMSISDGVAITQKVKGITS